MAEYNLRALNVKDLTAITLILNRIGFAELKPLIAATIKEVNAAGNKEDIHMKVGFSIGLDVGNIVLANYEKCADVLIEWLGDVAGMEKQAIEELSLADFAELLFAVFRKDDFKDFFTVVSSLFK